MKQLTVKFTGIDSLIMNNPQTVDPLNKYSKEKKVYTSKRVKTDEDVLSLRSLEIRSKLYFDEKMKVYVPSTWVTSSIIANSWAKGKVKKADIRSSVFTTEPKLKLYYDGDNTVNEPLDIVGNGDFHHVQILKQAQVRIVKASPKFNNWSFSVMIDFDDAQINESELKQLIEYGAKYGGYGDFRPTFGRCGVTYD